MKETLLRRWRLFRQIRKHRKLADKRSLNYESNKTAKIVVYIMTGFGFLYLIFLAVMLSMIANSERSLTASEIICSLTPFIFALDFGMRFISQQAPASLVKPYILLPVSRYACVDALIGSSLATGYNFSWFVMLVPYIFMSVLFVDGLWVSLGILLFFYLLALCSSQFFLIVKVLINDSPLWWLLPAAVGALIFMPWYVGPDASIGTLLEFYSNIGTTMEDGQPWPLAVIALLLVVLVLINRKVQFAHIMAELSQKQSSKPENVIDFSFFSRYGELGEWIKLEIKLNLRNKNMRKALIVAASVVIMMSLLIAFTDLYNDQWSTNFWCLYNYVIFAAMLSLKVMCPEGNYLDFLMVHKENILSLLHAKYICYNVLLLLPFLMMLPTVFMGKWPLLMLVAYLIFTMGFQQFLLFQMAVFNKQTTPLNAKFISKNNMESNYLQIVVEMVAFFLPIAAVTVIQLFTSNTLSYVLMLVIGLAFMLTNKFWLRNIYNRMMRRKYKLMEGFRASRMLS